jgi:hypothetical protein
LSLPEGQGDGERRPLPGCALGGDIPTVTLDDLAAGGDFLFQSCIGLGRIGGAFLNLSL